MQWNQQTQQKMIDVVAQVVPEQFRDIALDGLRTDAAKYAQERGANEIEEQDLVKAISQAPGFIQEELSAALSKMGSIEPVA
jgi:hypothetical protein